LRSDKFCHCFSNLSLFVFCPCCLSQIANLLYRLRNGGEMPESLHPQVWWVLIGTGDLGMGCSVESVVAGNIGIVKEIRERHNNQHGHKTLTPVVINSILPRGHMNLVPPGGDEQQQEPTMPWHTIRQVNQQLECFASLTEGVHFVNVSDVFLMTNDTGTFLNDTLVMSDHLHPSTEGNRQWEELIVSNVMELII
jgi:lysophospholipase L1-like esterase